MRGHTAGGFDEDLEPDRYTTLFGFDATIRWRPLQRAIYRSFIGRSEIVWTRRDRIDDRQVGLGYYVSGHFTRWRGNGLSARVSINPIGWTMHRCVTRADRCC
jgi:hypothetical protein